MLGVNKLENTTARQCDGQVYVHIILNRLDGPQVPYLKLLRSIPYALFNFYTLLLNHHA